MYAVYLSRSGNGFDWALPAGHEGGDLLGTGGVLDECPDDAAWVLHLYWSESDPRSGFDAVAVEEALAARNAAEAVRSMVTAPAWFPGALRPGTERPCPGACRPRP